MPAGWGLKPELAVFLVTRKVHESLLIETLLHFIIVDQVADKQSGHLLANDFFAVFVDHLCMIS